MWLAANICYNSLEWTINMTLEWAKSLATPLDNEIVCMDAYRYITNTNTYMYVG